MLFFSLPNVTLDRNKKELPNFKLQNIYSKQKHIIETLLDSFRLRSYFRVSEPVPPGWGLLNNTVLEGGGGGVGNSHIKMTEVPSYLSKDQNLYIDIA